MEMEIVILVVLVILLEVYFRHELLCPIMLAYTSGLNRGLIARIIEQIFSNNWR